MKIKKNGYRLCLRHSFMICNNRFQVLPAFWAGQDTNFLLQQIVFQTNVSRLFAYDSGKRFKPLLEVHTSQCINIISIRIRVSKTPQNDNTFHFFPFFSFRCFPFASTNYIYFYTKVNLFSKSLSFFWIKIKIFEYN